MPRKQRTIADDVAAVRPKARRDPWLWGTYCIIVFISIVELYSASSREIVAGNVLWPVVRHIILLAIGLGIMIGLQRTNYLKLYRYTWVIVLITLLATVYTMVAGLDYNNAQRAFSVFGLFTVQPSEMIKFTAALVIARMLGDYVTRFDPDPAVAAEQRRNNVRILVWSNVIILGFCALIISQGLTNTVIMVMISLSLMAIAGVRFWHYMAILAVYGILAGAGAIYKTQFAHNDEKDRTATRQNRITAFLRPNKWDSTINTDNAQEQYSFIAQANGGVTGVFPGNSRETARLPLAFSDYIYAIIVEDIGLWGGLVVMGLYLALLGRAAAIGINCRKTFPALLVVGMALFIVCQALVHIAIVTGAAPVSGEPLPFISKGGSSVIMSSLALGVMLSVSRYALRKGVKQEANENIEGLSDKDLVDNPTQIS